MVERMTYRIDACCNLVLLESGKDWPAQYQDNVTKCDTIHGADGLISQWGRTKK